MHKKNNIGLKVLLFLGISALLIAPFISSCGKAGSSSASSLNIQYQVINLSPDLGPVSLYIDFLPYNNLNFYYASPSGYFYLTSIDTPFQIRPSPTVTTSTTVISTSNIFSSDDILKPNGKYTLFITGFQSTQTLDTVFLRDDTASAPAIGKGKVRFVNCSPLSTPFDVLANGTGDTAFTKLAYKKVSSYVQVPAGNYNFQVYPAGNRTTILGSESNVIIQDGRLYTVYSYGVAGHTDSLAFGMGVITNK